MRFCGSSHVTSVVGQLNYTTEHKERATTPHMLYNSLFFFYLFLYFLFLFSRREVDGGTVGYRVGRCVWHRSDHPSFIAPRCNNQGGKVARFRRHGKKAQ
jgi:hypothetical protein